MIGAKVHDRRVVEGAWRAGGGVRRYRGGMSREAWIVFGVVGGILAVATLVGAVILGVKVWRTRALLGELGAGGKVAFYGALVYTFLPVDILPDPIYLDDMGILAGALIYLTRQVQKNRANGVLTPNNARITSTHGPRQKQ